MNLLQRIFGFGANSLGGEGDLQFRHILLRNQKIVNDSHTQNQISDSAVQILQHCADLGVRERRRPVAGHAQG